MDGLILMGTKHYTKLHRNEVLYAVGKTDLGKDKTSWDAFHPGLLQSERNNIDALFVRRPVLGHRKVIITRQLTTS